MTTIVWDGKTKTLAADSRTAVRSAARSILRDGTDKIITFSDEDNHEWSEDEHILLIAGAGSVEQIEFLITLVLTHGNKIVDAFKGLPNLHKVAASLSRAGVLMITTKFCYHIEIDFKRPEIIKVSKHSLGKQLSIGSGSKYANLAMKVFGFSAIHAARFARLSDTGSGGPIISFTVLPTGKIRENAPVPDRGVEDDFNVFKATIAALPTRAVDMKPRNLYGQNTLIQKLVREKRNPK